MRRTLPALLAAVLMAPPVRAHVPENLTSVHFNSASPDFGLVPRRGPLHIGDDIDRPPRLPYYSSWIGPVDEQELTGERDSLRAENRRRRCNEGDAAAISGDLARAGRIWRGVAARFGTDGGLRDRLELSGHGFVPGTAEYVAALRRLEGANAGWNGAGRVFDRLADDASLPAWLREHALYQRACVWRAWLSHERAIALWQAQIRRFPEGKKRAAALLMIARSAILPERGERATGRAALDQLDRSFPKHPFRVAVRGLRAKLDFDAGKLDAAASAYCALNDGDSIARVRARNADPHLGKRLITLQLIAYLRAFDRAESHDAYVKAGKGIDRTLEGIAPEIGRTLLARLVDEPELARPYLYYRLYHCDNTPRDIARLGTLADRIAARFGKDRLPATVRVRLAEVYYRQRRWRTAIQWAQGATVERDQRVRARALYVRAASLHKRGRISAARRDLETLLADCPASPLRHGTRELLALCCEAQEDWERALEMYTALDYEDDRAYLIDARMPLASLERYGRRHPAERELIAFSLGIRYLREEDWSAARRWLERVSPAAYRKFLNREAYPEWGFDSEFVVDPRRTLAHLSALHAATRRARTRTARASAFYAYARKYYTAGLLQLYNPPLWRFEREMMFDFCWNEALETPADRAAIRRYMYRHEVYAHTRRICLRIARDYPDTPTAPYALYRAACASWRLSGFNDWWEYTGDPRDGVRFDHNAEAVRLMERVARQYPKHPLARAAEKHARVFAGKEYAE